MEILLFIIGILYSKYFFVSTADLFTPLSYHKILKAGSSCSLTPKENGICVPLIKCKHPDLEKNKKICEWHGSNPVVCCPQNKQVGADTTTTTTTTTTTNTHINVAKYDWNRCGMNKKKTIATRIVGGSPADPKAWPWMASVINASGGRFCGGALITDRHVLTAAHCFIFYRLNDIIVRLGDYSFEVTDYDIPSDFEVIDVRTHQGFVETTNENDIALLLLDRPADFNDFVGPVCLPPPNDEFENKSGYVIGYGSLNYGGPVTDVLQEVVVPIWKQSDCVKTFAGNKVVPTMLCAGDKAGGKDSCQGDSGGPLMIEISPEARWHIAGIVSWGKECARPNSPGVYTRVNKYLDWINENAIF